MCGEMEFRGECAGFSLDSSGEQDLSVEEGQKRKVSQERNRAVLILVVLATDVG